MQTAFQYAWTLTVLGLSGLLMVLSALMLWFPRGVWLVIGLLGMRSALQNLGQAWVYNHDWKIWLISVLGMVPVGLLLWGMVMAMRTAARCDAVPVAVPSTEQRLSEFESDGSSDQSHPILSYAPTPVWDRPLGVLAAKLVWYWSMISVVITAVGFFLFLPTGGMGAAGAHELMQGLQCVGLIVVAILAYDLMRRLRRQESNHVSEWIVPVTLLVIDLGVDLGRVATLLAFLRGDELVRYLLMVVTSNFALPVFIWRLLRCRR